MDDNKPGADAGETVTGLGAAPPDERRKRLGPTIDLEPSEVSDVSPATAAPDQEQTADAAASGPEADQPDDKKPVRPSVLPIAASALAGALAAALILAIASWAEWPFVLNDGGVAEREEAAILSTLNARVGKIETAASDGPSQPAPADAALAERLKTVETSLASLREDVTALRAQAEKTAADVKGIKSTPSDSSPAPAADLSAIEERLGKIERMTAELAAAPSSPAQPVAPTPDPKLQHVAAASALDQAVRSGAPFATSLAAVKGFAAPDFVKPLEPFAASGIPDAASLSRDLLALLPRLEPKPVDAPAPNGILDRLQHSAMKLVRVRRVDEAGDVAAVAARAEAAAKRNDVNEARRELAALPSSERAPVQPWLDKLAARDAALAASQKIVAGTMAALPAPAASRQ
ncbi:COG4223 family protein [Afipia sp. TerB]